jgi:hypothetical protein
MSSRRLARISRALPEYGQSRAGRRPRRAVVRRCCAALRRARPAPASPAPAPAIAAVPFRGTTGSAGGSSRATGRRSRARRGCRDRASPSARTARSTPTRRGANAGTPPASRSGSAPNSPAGRVGRPWRHDTVARVCASCANLGWRGRHAAALSWSGGAADPESLDGGRCDWGDCVGCGCRPLDPAAAARRTAARTVAVVCAGESP